MAKSNDKIWQQLRRKIGQIKQSHVRVGVLAGGKGTERGEGGISMLELAAIHEFGAPKANIPARSFIQRTFIEADRELEEVTANLARKIVTKTLTPDQALGQLGAWGAARVQKFMSDGDVKPPLKDETIAAKGSSTPLVDNGQLRASVTYEVKKR